ncbi:tail fiber protein, partial [Escherichia coli]|nr:tail fiber protein [Escherichia coli]
MLQEELCSVVEASGASLEKGRHDQLLTALRALLLSRKNPFGDIKSDGTVKTALENLGLGEGSALPVGVPVPWPSATPPTGWLKCNGAAFSAEEYPELAKAYPTNKLPDLRGEFIRGWDDGRGVDSGRGLLTAQAETKITNHHGNGGNADDISAGVSGSPPKNFVRNADSAVNAGSGFTAFGSGNLTMNGVTSYFGVRPRNIAFNYIVRAA